MFTYLFPVLRTIHALTSSLDYPARQLDATTLHRRCGFASRTTKSSWQTEVDNEKERKKGRGRAYKSGDRQEIGRY